MTLRTVAAVSLGVSAALALAIGCGDTVEDVPDAADAATDVAEGSTGLDARTTGDAAGSVDASDAGVDLDGSEAGARPRLGRCSSNEECGPSGQCVEIVAGGFRTCLFPLPKSQPCTDAGSTGPFDDECCGACDGGGVCSLRMSCGGAFFNPYNVCVHDACKSDVECGTNGVCIPAVDGGQRSCLVTNECKVHTDCKAAPDGICAITGQIGPASECRAYACGGDPSPSGPMRCHYGAECASDGDCDGGHCEVDTGSGRPLCGPQPRGDCPPPP